MDINELARLSAPLVDSGNQGSILEYLSRIRNRRYLESGDRIERKYQYYLKYYFAPLIITTLFPLLSFLFYINVLLRHCIAHNTSLFIFNIKVRSLPYLVQANKHLQILYFLETCYTYINDAKTCYRY